MTDKKQQLVLSIIDFLNQSIDDGTVKQDDREGLEVASPYLCFVFLLDANHSVLPQFNALARHLGSIHRTTNSANA